MKVIEMFSWKGEVNRKDFIITGFVLFAIKFNLDKLTSLLYGKYLVFPEYYLIFDTVSLSKLTQNEIYMYLTLIVQSIPFIWIGTMMCLKRLRNANLSHYGVLLFFIPFINIIMFILLSFIPEKDEPKEEKVSYLDRLIPKSLYGSAFFAIGIVTLLSLILTAFLVFSLKDYGWSLFVGIPFFLGFASVLIYSYKSSLEFKDAMSVTFYTVLFFCLMIFALAFEGVICLAMAFPIILGIAIIGATIAYAIHDNNKFLSLNLIVVPFLIIPILGINEHYQKVSPPLIEVSSEVIVNASKQEVWNELIAFSYIEQPEEFIFKTGIAYPIKAEINGTGKGAIRRCKFTTGDFVEPIQKWDEPNKLEFGVIDQPPPLVEMSFYKNLNLTHLDNYFKSTKGQFKLESLPNNKTKLIGTTWYYHDIWPSNYWKLWSDYILHKIHLRVLNHIKNESEKKGKKT